jgi:hypothetical protein
METSNTVQIYNHNPNFLANYLFLAGAVVLGVFGYIYNSMNLKNLPEQPEPHLD